MIPVPLIIEQIAQACQAQKGCLWLVGGSVRDALLGKSPKDFDVEIHQMEASIVQILLQEFGSTKRVGKSFSVFKLQYSNQEIDISLPVREQKDEPNLGIDEALRRRDLSINAMAYNPLTKNLYDPFGGSSDLKNKILRATDPETFVKDPLRVFRVAQFASRLSFSISPSLIKICQTLSLPPLAGERLSIELHKMWLKSPKPSVGLQAMKKLRLFSRVFPFWREGSDVDVCRAIDRTVSIPLKRPEKVALCWIAALHKTPIDDAERLLLQLKIFSIEQVNVQSLVLFGLRHHHTLTQMSSDVELRTLSEEGPLRFLFFVSYIISGVQQSVLLERSKELGIYLQPMPTLLQGRDLLPLGIKGKAIGTKLKELRRLQIQGRITDRESALSWLQKGLI